MTRTCRATTSADCVQSTQRGSQPRLPSWLGKSFQRSWCRAHHVHKDPATKDLPGHRQVARQQGPQEKQDVRRRDSQYPRSTTACVEKRVRRVPHQFSARGFSEGASSKTSHSTRGGMSAAQPRPPSQQVSQIRWQREHWSFARISIRFPPHTGQAGRAHDAVCSSL